MATIKVKTVITQLQKTGYFKPQAPLFSLVNDGEVNIFINSVYLVRPGDSFSINLEAVVSTALENGNEVVNDTQYHIVFQEDPILRTSAQLIEVYLKKEK